jgi:HlyD family secretion protein
VSNLTRSFSVVVVVAATLGLWWFLRGSDGTTAELSASGTVEATESDLGFQIAGRIEAISVREGDRVGSGSVLARLDVRELQARRGSAEARMEAARARLREMENGSRPEEIAQARAAAVAARARLDQADRDLARTGKLFEGGAVSRATLERARMTQEVAVAEVNRAEEQARLLELGPRPEQLEAQRAMVRELSMTGEELEAALRNGTVIAPFGGLVVRRHREPGETVAPGAPVLTIRDLSDRWIRIYIQEDRIGRVGIGQAAAITIDSYPDRTYRGEVFFIGDEAEFTPRTVQTAEERTKLVYPVKVRILQDTALDLKPGIPADVLLLEESS